MHIYRGYPALRLKEFQRLSSQRLRVSGAIQPKDSKSLKGHSPKATGAIQPKDTCQSMGKLHFFLGRARPKTGCSAGAKRCFSSPSHYNSFPVKKGWGYPAQKFADFRAFQPKNATGIIPR